jgi:hypothetical protein
MHSVSPKMLRLSSDAIERILRATGLDMEILAPHFPVDDGGGPPDPCGDRSTPVSDKFELPLFVTNQEEPPVIEWDQWPVDSDLAGCLRKDILYYYSAFQLQRDKKYRDRIRKLKTISKAIGRFTDLLDSDDEWLWEGDDTEYVPVLSRTIDLQKSIGSEIDVLENRLFWGEHEDTMGLIKSRGLQRS